MLIQICSPTTDINIYGMSACYMLATGAKAFPLQTLALTFTLALTLTLALALTLTQILTLTLTLTQILILILILRNHRPCLINICIRCKIIV